MNPLTLLIPAIPIIYILGLVAFCHYKARKQRERRNQLYNQRLAESLEAWENGSGYLDESPRWKPRPSEESCVLCGNPGEHFITINGTELVVCSSCKADLT